MASKRAPVARPISISFPAEDVQRMNKLMQISQLPEEQPLPTAAWQLGVDLQWLRQLQLYWNTEFVYSDLEAELNRLPHYMANFEHDGVDLHFVHVRSRDEKAIPLILLHGWPGTFYDFHKIIEPLTKPSAPGAPSFHVVIPSLPGYFMSSYPNRAGWTLVDTARVLNRLMTEVLGYDKYMAQGGDWGSFILRALLHLPETSQNVAVAHFNMFFSMPTGFLANLGALKAYTPAFFNMIPGYTAFNTFMEKRVKSLMFTSAEQHALDRTVDYATNGRAYTEIQGTKPLTVGYAMYTSPLSLLAYIGEKFHAWSDPSTPDFDTKDLISTVALYYLSKSFHTSVLIYNQSRPVAVEMVLQPARWAASKDTLVGYTLFPYEVGGSPRSFIGAVTNLVFYKEKSRGGHFPALDSPAELVTDLRELAALHWAY